MDIDSPESRYRSRILREMNANRENPFNSPPSSTGSHGTLDPTMTSVYPDPEGDSTRKLNDDIARITGNKDRKQAIDWDAIHKKWPDFYPKPKPLPTDIRKSTARPSKETAPVASGVLTAPASPVSRGSEFKENRPPKPTTKKRFSIDDFTLDSFTGSSRTRAEMQPRVESESDASSVLNISPDRFALLPPTTTNNNNHNNRLPHQPQNRSPLAREHTRSPSTPDGSPTPVRRMSLPAALSRPAANVAEPSPLKVHRKLNFAQHVLSKEVKAATKQQQKKQAKQQQGAGENGSGRRLRGGDTTTQHDMDTMGNTNRSFIMPDVSNLGDFVSGKLEFNGAVKNGVPILVRNGKVVDVADEQKRSNGHAKVDGLKVPEDEEKIFVSMDMIRDEIIALQEHDDMVQEYADGLEMEVEELQTQIEILKGKSGNTLNLEKQSGEQVSVNEALLDEKKKLDEEVVILRYQLQEMTKKHEVLNQKYEKLETEKSTAVNDRERAMKKFQTACENINQLENQLDLSTKDLRVTQKHLDATLEVRESESALIAEVNSLKETIRKLRSENESLKRNVSSLRDDNADLRTENESLRKENQSLRSNSRVVMSENEELRCSIDSAKGEISEARVELERLHEVIVTLRTEKSTYKQDNDSLVRNNDKYFSDNKTLRLQASKFERNLQDLASDKDKLRQEVEFLKTQIDHMRQSTIRRGDLTAHSSGPTMTRGLGEDNMTSAFFVPDITVHTDDNTVPVESTRTFNRRMMAHRQENLGTQTMDITGEYKEQHTHGVDFTASSFKDMETGEIEDESVEIIRPLQSKVTKNGNSVKFDVPDMTASTEEEPTRNLTTSAAVAANRSSKRRSSLKAAQGQPSASAPTQPTSASPTKEDTETGSAGFTSNDTQNLSLHIEAKGKQPAREEEHTRNTTKTKKMRKQKSMNNLTQDLTNMSLGQSQMRNTTQGLTMNMTDQFSQRLDGHGQDFTLHSVDGGLTEGLTQGSTRNVTREHTNAERTTKRATERTGEFCPGLSVDARKILNELCEHSCRNCTVCSRIATHKQTISCTEAAAGKKRITVSRPIPISERDNIPVAAARHFEDPTLRPSQPPGNALAIVIKALEDESEHLNMELVALQAKYNDLDKSLGKRERKVIARQLKSVLKRLEAKNDQIYALYDVLEGQKAAGQAMTEEQIETTIMSITGMNVAEVDLSQQLTWEGIRDA